MDFKALRWLLLFAVVIVQAGCAEQTYDPANDLQPVESHDDSHGWGTNVQASGTSH
jgi:hypothetical protein